MDAGNGNRHHCAVVDIAEGRLDPSAALEFVSDPGFGGITLFVGRVRDLNHGRVVTGVSDDMFEPLARNGVAGIAARIEAEFARVQFTPDLLPADLTGTEVWRAQESRFEFQPGPIFHSLLLADEINRAPAKVQSALLEAMAERQVTVGRHTYPLPSLFLVMATQNPIEQEGTFPLPEAQLDRFLMYVRIGYPDAQSEAEILRLNRMHALEGSDGAMTPRHEKIPQSDVFAARRAVLELHMAPALERYLIEIVLTTRDASRYDPQLAQRISWGASPRGSIALERCARARAWLAGRDFVTPDDIRAVAPDVLRHRVLPSFEASAEGWDGERLVQEVLARVPHP